MPTEAQWERAALWDARTRTQRRFPWGEAGGTEDEWAGLVIKPANLLDEAFSRKWGFAPAYHGYDDGFAGPAPVGSFPDGASAVGALDMAGNVREWCEDAYDPRYYARSPARDPVNEAMTGPLEMRITRGSSFALGVSGLRMTTRGGTMVEFRAWDLGFRVARAAR